MAPEPFPLPHGRIDRRTFLRRFLSTFIPLAAIVLLLTWLIYYFQYIKTEKEILQARESNLLLLEKELVQRTIQGIITDLHILAADQDLIDFVYGKSPQHKNHLETEFLSFSSFKGIYDQIRVLDAAGREVIRVDLKGGRAVLIPKDQLQDKSRRYYFRDIMALGRGEIFMSPFDLNIEHGELERPFKPMIRFGMPLFDQKGHRRGAIVINYLGAKLFADLARLSSGSPGTLMVLNAGGYWLKGRRPEDEWGFMLPGGQERTFARRYPAVWAEILRSDAGQRLTKNGLFSYCKVYPLQNGLHSATGSGQPFQKSQGQLKHNEYFWVLLSHVRPGDMYGRHSDVVRTLVLGDGALLVVLGVVLGLLTSAQMRRRSAEKALIRANQELEEKVHKRTEALQQTNRALTEEIANYNRVIAEKDKIEAQLRQAQKMEAIGTLAGGIAHDFNNILGAILGYAELARDETPPGSTVADDLNSVLEAGYRAKGLVQQILAFSRQAETECLPLQPALIVKEVAKMLRSSLPSTIDIALDVADGMAYVFADPTQIHQIFMNLCTNAFHAMEDSGGRLSITAKTVVLGDDALPEAEDLRPGSYLRLSVGDTGPGIAPEIRDKIFDPYFSTKTLDKGTGLGLAIVHGIVRSCHGFITVDSQEGRGSIFHLFLPVVEIAAVPEGIDQQTEPTGNERILFVDDEVMLVAVGRHILEKLGYRVTACNSSLDAWETFQRQPDRFDLVISDQTMPGMTGLELAKRILQLRPEMPVIICTGFSSVISAEKANALGIRQLAMKPLDKGDFARVIRKVLDGPTGGRHPV